MKFPAALESLRGDMIWDTGDKCSGWDMKRSGMITALAQKVTLTHFLELWTLYSQDQVSQVTDDGS